MRSREDAMKRRDAMRLGVAAGVLMAVGLGCSGAALAQEKMVLKASDVHPEGYPTVQAVEDMGKKLSAATNGRLTIQMFASMQLGGEKHAIAQAQVRDIQSARVSVREIGPVKPTLTISSLPFTFIHTAHTHTALSTPHTQR